MKLGIDFGNTIMHSVREPGRIESVWTVQPNAFDVIRTWTKYIGPENVFIISRVDSKLTLQKILCWLKETDFYADTGFLTNHVHFCQTRQEKSPICEELGITVHIDDRPEVMAHLDSVPSKILFKPISADLEQWRPLIKGDVYYAPDWLMVDVSLESIFDKEGKPDKRAGTSC